MNNWDPVRVGDPVRVLFAICLINKHLFYDNHFLVPFLGTLSGSPGRGKNDHIDITTIHIMNDITTNHPVRVGDPVRVIGYLGSISLYIYIENTRAT